MTGACRICNELILPRPVAVVGKDRPAAETRALAEAATRHLVLRHKDLVQAFNVVLRPAADYLALKIVESDAPEFGERAEHLLKVATQMLRSAELVKRVDKPAPGGQAAPGRTNGRA